ncbi:MAG TPA: hypothetical protein PKA27_10075 [Fimbriimonadaceae bacterium]|nr:hypothetical protein [Fimbriimonadaceae bacterium]
MNTRTLASTCGMPLWKALVGMGVLRTAVCFAGLAVTCFAGAQTTSMWTIPVADILGHREVTWGYSLSGSERNISGGTYGHYHNGIVGLFDRIELAFGNDFFGTTTYGAKVLLWEGDTCAISGGYHNFDRYRSDLFLVSRYDGKGYRLHAGLQRDDRWRGLVGVDFPLFGDHSGAIDHVTGPNGYTSAGVNLSLPRLPGLTISTYVGVPNTKGDGITHTVCITYGFRF